MIMIGRALSLHAGRSQRPWIIRLECGEIVHVTIVKIAE